MKPKKRRPQQLKIPGAIRLTLGQDDSGESDGRWWLNLFAYDFDIWVHLTPKQARRLGERLVAMADWVEG